MKFVLLMLPAALGVAVIALVLDSPLLILLSVLMLAAGTVGVLMLGAKTALRGDFVKRFAAILGAALVLAALGVSAIVVGERGDAPGLVLWGIVLIVSVLVGGLALGARIAQRSSR